MKKISRRNFLLVTSVAGMSALLAGCGGSKSGNSTASSAAAGSTSAGDSGAKGGYTIAICEPGASDEATARDTFCLNYLSEVYNCKFIISEPCKDSDAVAAFIENCADMGCDGFIDFSTSDCYNDCQMCRDYGMAYMYNGGKGANDGNKKIFAEQPDNFVGCFGADVPSMAKLYGDYLDEHASDDGSEGFMILSSNACTGGYQQTEITRSLLEAIASKYDLTYTGYEDNLDALIAIDAPTEVANSKGLNIYIYPGNHATNTESWLSGVSSVLQTGKYAFLASAGQTFAVTAQTVAEIEAEFNFNITCMSPATISETLVSAFNTKDQFGNPSIDFVTVKSATMTAGFAFAMMYNFLSGHSDMMRPDGKADRLAFSQWAISDADTLNTIKDWDQAATQDWAANSTWIDRMLAEKNPDLTLSDMQDAIFDFTVDYAIEIHE